MGMIPPRRPKLGQAMPSFGFVVATVHAHTGGLPNLQRQDGEHHLENMATNGGRMVG